MENQSETGLISITLGILVWPIYLVVIFLISLFMAFNQKRLKKLTKIDGLFLLMGLYIANFLFTSFYFRSMNKYFRILTPAALMYLCIYFTGRFQIIGVTGGIACGKSAVSKYFNEKHGIPLIDCDVLSRVIFQPGRPAYKKVLKHFGDRILRAGTDEIDRKALGKIVFAHPQHRKFLTKTTGIYIFIEILKSIYKLCILEKHQMVILDAPLLYESVYLQYLCFPIAVVYVSDEQVQIQRLIQRDSCTQDEALLKIQSQMPLKKKMDKADILINNDGDLNELHRNISRQFPKFLI